MHYNTGKKTPVKLGKRIAATPKEALLIAGTLSLVLEQFLKAYCEAGRRWNKSPKKGYSLQALVKY